jgi:hypothetical protein
MLKLVILDFCSGDVLILPYTDNKKDIEDNIIQLIKDNVLDVKLDNIHYMVTSEDNIQYF